MTASRSVTCRDLPALPDCRCNRASLVLREFDRDLRPCVAGLHCCCDTSRAELPGPQVEVWACGLLPEFVAIPGSEVEVIRILVVDDNPAVRRYLRAILEQQETWSVCGEARTGAEALHEAITANPDLIILDYQMPDLNGVDVARQITEFMPAVPILMVTLHLSKQLTEAAREAGVRGACAKQDIGSVVEAIDVLLHDRTYFPASPVT